MQMRWEISIHYDQDSMLHSPGWRNDEMDVAILLLHIDNSWLLLGLVQCHKLVYVVA